MNLKRVNLPPQYSFQKLLEMTESEFFRMYSRLFNFYRGPHPQHIDRAVRCIGAMTIRCGTTGNAKRECGTKALETFEGFLLFSRLDMRNWGLRLAKEESMSGNGLTQIAECQDDNF